MVSFYLSPGFNMSTPSKVTMQNVAILKSHIFINSIDVVFITSHL